MQLSYWEIKNWFSNVDFTIVGSGIVGLHTALALRERFPSAKVLILENVLRFDCLKSESRFDVLFLVKLASYFRYRFGLQTD